jgi:hypothetical protein
MSEKYWFESVAPGAQDIGTVDIKTSNEYLEFESAAPEALDIGLIEWRQTALT